MVKEYLEDKKLMKSIIIKYACDLGKIWENSHMENFKLTIIDKNNKRSIDFNKLKKEFKSTYDLQFMHDLKGIYMLFKDGDLFIVGNSRENIFKRLKNDFKKDEGFKQLLESSNVKLTVIRMHDMDNIHNARLEAVVTDIYTKLFKAKLAQEYELKI
ncbi:MAG TPA: hypothetical protein H9994_08920 [Candidatus Salinicoccus merdavium]|nr:hypothetical protein [Candidatus Salinicoccus merdavium]